MKPNDSLLGFPPSSFAAFIVLFHNYGPLSSILIKNAIVYIDNEFVIQESGMRRMIFITTINYFLGSVSTVDNKLQVCLSFVQTMTITCKLPPELFAPHNIINCLILHVVNMYFVASLNAPNYRGYISQEFKGINISIRHCIYTSL